MLRMLPRAARAETADFHQPIPLYAGRLYTSTGVPAGAFGVTHLRQGGSENPYSEVNV